jgi:CheY-like chemotaxis protein
MRRKLKCILLVDDDEPTNFLNSILLRNAGISESIVAFQWGEEALDYLINKHGASPVSDERPTPDLILLDINMPKMNGWEFVDEYRKLPQELLDRIKLIMLTTSINPDDEAKARSITEIHDFFSKPLTSNRVADIVHKHFVDYV